VPDPSTTDKKGEGMFKNRSWIGAAVIGLVAVIALAAGCRSRNTVVEGEAVGIYMESVQRQIDFAELQKRYPGERAETINPGLLKADTIVGWYDKGHNYHEQKMQNNLKSLGGIRILPEMLRGEALRGEIGR
jgi:hypothetical protein